MYNRQPRDWSRWPQNYTGDVIEPEGYIEERNQSRAAHDYSVTVDENLLTVDGTTLVLPHIRGIGAIVENYTEGRGSHVNLCSFDITVVGTTNTVQVMQGEPPFWMCAYVGSKKQHDLAEVFTAREMVWHINQLAIQRHNVLAAINGYINKVREMDPANRQLQLGF